MSHPQDNIQIQRAKHFLEQISALILRENLPLAATFRHCPEPVPFAEKESAPYRPIQEGERWGSDWDSAWFHLSGAVPAAWKGRHVAAVLCFNGEGLVFLPDGKALQGITNGSIFDRNAGRNLVSLFPKARGSETVELWVEAAANSLFGLDDPGRNGPLQPATPPGREGRVNTMRLAIVDEDLWHLRLDLMPLIGLLDALPPSSTRHACILQTLIRAMDAFGGNPARARTLRDILAPALASPANASELQATAVGHAHIDTGWLWPVRESVRKCARTFSSQLRLIDRYPTYVFGASQPQHYAFMKEKYPELYKRIKKAVRDGRWECQGGMWVEADCNLISGESMVRQFLHGKNFFMDEFGVDVRNLWLPDVFGYSAALPQIIRKSGCAFFVTQKISWNQTNRFPHNTFRWRGIDGTEVLTHFPPENNYNADLHPTTLNRGIGNFQEKGILPGFLSLFGIGDGGGGPHEEHIEAGLRQANLEGSPKVHFAPAQSFLDAVVPYRDTLPLWDGELYLELHRGTLTSQARTKRANRRIESRLRQVEFLWACLPLTKYPARELDAIWKKLLINQFHDIIPGSSIGLVYETTEREHAEALQACDQLMEKAVGALFQPAQDQLTLVNCLSCAYERPIALPKGWEAAATEDGTPVPTQTDDEATVAAISIPPMQSLCLRRAPGPSRKNPSPATNTPLTLENDLIRYAFAENGALTSVYDKECQREVLAPGQQGNLLTLYEDRPNQWDAWDVDFFYQNQCIEQAAAQHCTRLPGGGIRESLRFELTIGQSSIVQTARLAANSKRLDFETQVDWHEKHRMLRVAFTVDIRARHFSSDIQYGYVERPTYQNTSWEQAKFEVVAHRYADLSESTYGVAILNNCKYGHKVLDNVLDLNLLRSPVYPDPHADEGRHHFTYAILPHKGDLLSSTVMTEAAALNLPPLNLPGRAGHVTPPVQIESTWVSLEVLKKAEKGNRHIIRLVETAGRHSPCTLHVQAPFKALTETNLIEWTEEAIHPITNGSCILDFKPFEIRTFILEKEDRT